MSKINFYYLSIFYFFSVLINLHLLRNLIPGFEIILIVFLLFALFISVNHLEFNMNNHIHWIFVLIFFTSLYVIIFSLFQRDFNGELLSLSQIINASARLLIMPLTAILFFIYVKDEKILFNLINIFIIISVLASLSYVYQYYFGAIEWFASGSGEKKRGLNYRFSSLHGSITVSAITLSIAFIAASYLYKSVFLKAAILLVISAGLIMSLQKASLFNAVLILFLIFLFSESKVKLFFLYLFFLTLFYFVFQNLYEYDNELILVSHLRDIIFHTIEMDLLEETTDVDSFSFRLYGGALNMISEYGWQMIIYGKGFVGVGATMGIPGGQSHNSFWDLFFMGGFIYFFLFVSLLISTMIILLKPQNKYEKIFAVSNIILIVNCLQGSILFFQPVTSFIFWLSIIYSSNKNFFNTRIRLK